MQTNRLCQFGIKVKVCFYVFSLSKSHPFGSARSINHPILRTRVQTLTQESQPATYIKYAFSDQLVTETPMSEHSVESRAMVFLILRGITLRGVLGEKIFY